MDSNERIIPFRIGGPIKDPIDFVGRSEILSDISRAMLSLQNVSLHGERRMGKTSLLLYLAHADTAQLLGLPKNHIPVYFDFQNYAKTDRVTLWQEIAKAVAESLKQRLPDKYAEAGQFQDTIVENLTIADGPESFGIRFGRAFENLENSGLKFHLLFDEFQRTADNPNLGESFYDALRGLITLANNVSYVIATRIGLSALQPHRRISSPFFNIFTTQILMPFRKDDAYDLIFEYFHRSGAGLALAEKLWREALFLYEVTGYHPFFLQTLCYHLYARLDDPDWPEGQAKQEALIAFEKDAKPHFQDYWDYSSDAEKALIKELAIKRPPGWKSPALRGPIETLKERGLIIEASESGQKWQLVSSCFREWVNSTIFPYDTPLADFVIITALEEEREAILGKLPRYQRLSPIEDDVRTYFSADLPVTFPEGSEGTYRILVMPLPGMGRIEAIAATQDAIRLWHPRYVILVGIAGGIAEEGIRLGDILVSTKIVDYELQKLTSKEPETLWEVYEADPRLVGAAQNFSDIDWLKLMITKRPGPGMPKRHIGPIASGDKVIAVGEVLAKYRDKWPKLIGVEMEAAGVATAAFQAADPPGFFVIRAVSDFADKEKGSDEVKKWRLYACDVAASYTIALLKSGPVLARMQAGNKGDQPALLKSSPSSSPFVYGLPVQPEEFVNREANLRTVFNRLRHGESTAIVGEPHIGKTSLLVQLADEKTQLRYLGDSVHRFIFLPLNLQTISSEFSPTLFWGKVLEPLRRLSGQESIALRLEHLAKADYPGDALEDFFGHLYQHKYQLVLLLDEFDRLLQCPKFKEFSFYATLRAVAASRSFSFVLASRLTLGELQGQVHELPASGGSPVFNYLIEVRLLPFDEKDVNALLKLAGDVFSSDDRLFIRFMAGRHPYLVQAMAAALLETTGEARYACAAERYYNRVCSHFDYLWRTLDDRTRTTAAVLGLVELGRCELGDDFDYSEIQNLSNLGARLRDLAQQGLAEQVKMDYLSDTRYLLWRDEPWILAAQAFICWIYDVIITGTHQLPAYEEWLINEGYRSLLKQEQWDQLLDTVRNAAGRKIRDIGAMAEDTFKKLTRRRENDSAH